MTAIDPDRFIEQAITEGGKRGLSALGEIARLVFLISEAEISCDMDGIDSFIDRYGTAGLSQLRLAFHAIGAELIAASCQTVLRAMPTPDDLALNRLNSRISNRAGYDYESIRKMVTERSVF